MAEHDVLYHELLEALQAGGCAICRLAHRAGDSYLNALIYEGVTDPGLRETLRDARGPCYRHAWQLADKRGAVLGTAIIYRDVINTLTRALESESSGASRLRRIGRPPPALAASRECPACRLEADAELRATHILLKHAGDPEVAQAYVAAGGLCLPHLQLALGRASAATARQIAGWQAHAWSLLRDDLDELIRKHDHRFQRERIAEREADSWLRAVAGIVGERDSKPD